MATFILQKKADVFSWLLRLSAVSSFIQVWIERHHQRRQLSGLDSRQLADLGLNAEQVLLETQKPFWK
ncbi:MAG: DUF1127 domain-containing protein [Gammaproteobacteria bacterium]|nr:DUF1127 domain-containing protein [Gammaproteobacteria bacterium]MBL6999043.1 DUF1127 domain-containing protein [Gammaproteobacteria bacterium]